IKAYEIVGSYCPGNYDLSINGVKFAGISQRRVRNGIAIQIYLDVEGDSKERARIVRQFYSLSKQDETTNFTYPDVNPNVMGTINELIHTSFTVDDVIQMIKQTLMELGAEVKIGNVMLSEENVFHKRFEQMQKRNEKIHIIKNRLQEYHDYSCNQFFYMLCAAVINANLYTSSSLQPRDKSFTGLFSPCKIGPTASKPPKRSVSL